MIETKKEVNYKINWWANEVTVPNVMKDRIHYFDMLRRFLKELDELSINDIGIRQTFKKYNMYFVDIDEIPRVNLDEPK